MKKFLPKVKFEIAPIQMEANKLFIFCYPNKTKWDWSDKIYTKHPKLKNELKNVVDKKEFFDKCYAYAEDFHRKKAKKLTDSKIKFQKAWDKVNKKYLEELSRLFEIEWPKDRKIIKAYVSVVPINPRYLDTWSFTVRYNDKIQRMKLTSVHEILHFLYFEKWKEVFPKWERKTFDNPHLIWKLSEILAPTIMNNNLEIQKIVKIKSYGYQEFQNIKIGKKKLMDHFEILYIKHLKSNNSFAKFLKISWQEVKKYKNILEKV